MYKAIRIIKDIKISITIYEPNDVVTVYIAGEPNWMGRVRQELPTALEVKNDDSPLYGNNEPRPEKRIGWFIVDPLDGGTARCVHTNEMTLVGGV